MKHLVTVLLVVTVAWVVPASGDYKPPVYDPHPTPVYDSHPPPVYDPHPNPGHNQHPGPSYGPPHPSAYDTKLRVDGCRNGAVLRPDGVCQQPINTRRVFVYTAPSLPRESRPLPPLPKPRVHTNVLFIRTPEGEDDPQPYVIPPPQQKNIIYVLDKKREQEHRVIEVPAPPQEKPHVYFVHFKDGENPILPDGTDLHTALGAAGVEHGDIGVNIGGIGGGGGINIGGAGGYGGNNVPDITVAGDVGIVDGGYGGNAGHDVVVDNGYGGNVDTHHY